MSLHLDVVAPPDLARSEWLTMRRLSLGASDIASVYDQNPYLSQYALWQEKTGRVAMGMEPPSEAAAMGIRLEPVVADIYAERHPEVEVLPTPGTCRAAEHPWMTATPDRMLAHPDYGDCGLEIKAPGFWQRRDWPAGEAPARVLLQAQQNMAVTGASVWVLAALLGGQHYEERVILRDQRIIDAIVRDGAAWWDEHVTHDVPPPVDGSEGTTKMLASLYEADPEGVLVLSPEAVGMRDAAERLAAIIKAAEAERAVLGNALRAAMGSATVACAGDQPIATWRESRPKRFDLAVFKAEHPELYEKYLNETVIRTLNWK